GGNILKLIIRLIAGNLVGITVGSLYYAFGGTFFELLARLFVTGEAILGAIIFFTIPFIILFFIASGISRITGGSGKVVGATLGVAYISTIGAGLLAY